LFCIMLLIMFPVMSQSNFYKGYIDGYKVGYCKNQIGCDPPSHIIPEGTGSYSDGYSRGYDTGLYDGLIYHNELITKGKDLLLVIIGNHIKSLREQKNISQQDLAARCNFGKANMRRIEDGRTNPTIFTLFKISQALKVNLSEIVGIDNINKL
jgi:DNA-binding XRE family transcriptional regulator